MKRNVGVWIDHRKAVIVTFRDQEEETREIQSHMEKHVRYSGGSNAPAEDQRDRKFTGHLDKYLDKVIASLRDADAVLIMGPGEAKVELKTRLEAQALGGNIIGIETVDKMTDQQIAAMVRDHLLAPGLPRGERTASVDGRNAPEKKARPHR